MGELRLDLMLPVSPNIIMLMYDGKIVQRYDRGKPRWTQENGGLKHRYKNKVDPFKMQYIEYLPIWKGRKQ